MLKVTAICAALIALATAPLVAHEREATLQRVIGPDDAFDVIIGTPNNGNAPIYDLGDTPDALVIHLTGGELWVGFDDAAKMLETIEMLRRPLGRFYLGSRDNPVAVYMVPKDRVFTAVGR